MPGIESILNPVSAGLGILEGGIQLFSNLGKEKRIDRELSKLQDPFYRIQSEYEENRNITRGMAGGGTPAAELDYATSESQRGLSAGISGTLQSGGSPGDIAKMFDIYNRNIDKTKAESANQHLKNIDYYMKTNADLAGQKNIQWSLNEKQPYERKFRQLTQQRYAAEQNAYGGANTLIGGIGALGTSLQNNSLLDKLFAEPAETPFGGTTGEGFNSRGYATGVF